MVDMDNVRSALGLWLGRWYASILPPTKQITEFAQRGLDKSIAMVPGRMIDAAEEMLNQWLRNDTDSAPTAPHHLPVVLVAMAHDMAPTGRDWGHNLSDEDFVRLKGDPKERVFKLKTQLSDVRVQLLFAAHEPDTARHLAALFALYVEGYDNKRTTAQWDYAGQATHWPMVLESDDVMASKVPTEAKNLNLLTLDFTFKVTQPFYIAPRRDEPNDGRGRCLENGYPDPQDPNGWPLVSDVDLVHSVLAPKGQGSAVIRQWSVTWMSNR